MTRPTQPPRAPRADQSHQIPVVPDQIGAAVRIIAVVFPLLDPDHPRGGLGDQGGVFAQQVGPVHLELCPELRHHQHDQGGRDGAQAPAVLREEPLPTAEIALVEEDAAGDARHTCAALDHHQGPHIALEVGKAGGREAGGKDLKQGQRLGWKEDIHNTPPVCVTRHMTGDAYLLPPGVV